MYLITAACIGMFLISHYCRGQEHLGCYADSRIDRLLPTLGEHSYNNTVDTCIDICKSNRTTYAGVELGFECWCGDFHNFSKHGVVTGPNSYRQWCNFPCSGNQSQTCGGLGHINVYSGDVLSYSIMCQETDSNVSTSTYLCHYVPVCPRGRYRDPGGDVGNCDSECYCNASHVCVYSTGQCPGGCQDGWYGTSCSLNASLTTPYSTSTSTEEVSLTEADKTGETATTGYHGPSTTDYTDTSHSRTDPDQTGETATTGIAVGVAIALLLIIIVIAVVLVCCYRRKQREPPDSGKEIRDVVTLPDDLYGEVDMEAKAACQRKRQEEDGDGVDKEGNTVVNNDLYGSVSNNSYPFEKEDTFGYVNVASKPPGWKKKNGKAAPVESYTMVDARCEPDARQKQPVQSDMQTVVDNALYGSPDAEDGGGGGFHGDEDGKSSMSTSPVEPLYDTPKRQSIAL